MRQRSEVHPKLALLPQLIHEARRKIESFDFPAVFAHLLDEIAGPTAEVEEPSGSSKRNPSLPCAWTSDNNARQRGRECRQHVRGLRRIAIVLTQEGQFQPTPPAPAASLAGFSFQMRRIVGRIKLAECPHRWPGIREGQLAAAATNDPKRAAAVRQSIFSNKDRFVLAAAAQRAIHPLQFDRVRLDRKRRSAE